MPASTKQLISIPGLFAGTIGVRRLLKMFERYNIKTTWFIPGHSLETFPEECRMIADAGHEIGMVTEDVNPIRPLLTYNL